MKKWLLSVVILLLSLYLIACTGGDKNNGSTVTTSKNPSPEEILKQDPHADIFLLKGTVYQTNIEWVDKLKLTKKTQISEITAISSNDLKNFQNGMANKLPKGTKIYSVNEREDVLITEINGKTQKYLALSEG
ncbi:hypothetical protein [Peribacillus muralis]|uniref:hypothetical protein n=1 Tax=Peribacillus muralis TaxID=264697 RepID=UPI00366C625A